jgi:hypothetical protein
MRRENEMGEAKLMQVGEEQVDLDAQANKLYDAAGYLLKVWNKGDFDSAWLDKMQEAVTEMEQAAWEAHTLLKLATHRIK